jgi:Tfp pilus assembly protein PilF
MRRGASGRSKGEKHMLSQRIIMITIALTLATCETQAQSPRAAEDHHKALSLDPQCALALLNRGIGYLQQGREEEARRDFDQALKIDPTLRSELEAIVGEIRRRLKKNPR